MAEIITHKTSPLRYLLKDPRLNQFTIELFKYPGYQLSQANLASMLSRWSRVCVRVSIFILYGVQ